MKKRVLMTVALLCWALPLAAQEGGFEPREAKDFKTLDEFPSVAAFEQAYEDYNRRCWDYYGACSASANCTALRGVLWDRELNIQYRKLMAQLAPAQKEKLKESQRQWLKMRDSSDALSQSLLAKLYSGHEGTMYQALSAVDWDKMTTPAIRERALLLKSWREFLQRKTPDDN